MVSKEPSIFLYVGEEKYLIEDAISKLRLSINGESGSDVDYRVFYGSENKSREIIDYARGQSFFSRSKIILVREADRLHKEDILSLIDYVKNPDRSTWLILESKDASIIEDFSVVARMIKVIRFSELKPSEISPWIKRYLLPFGKTIEEDALEVLKELKGRNLSLLSQELKKAVIFIGERKTITVDDIEELVGRSNIESGFDLAKAISARNIDHAMTLVKDLFLFGGKPNEIIGLLGWHYNRLLKGKILQGKESDPEIASALRISNRYQDQFFDELRQLDIEDIKSKLNMLLEADVDVKRSRFSPELVVGTLISKLCLT